MHWWCRCLGQWGTRGGKIGGKMNILKEKIEFSALIKF